MMFSLKTVQLKTNGYTITFNTTRKTLSWTMAGKFSHFTIRYLFYCGFKSFDSDISYFPI